MTSTQQIRFAQFSAREAESITAVSPDAQRSWRAQRFLPAQTSWRSGFSAEQLCQLALLGLLAGAGVRMSIAAALSERVAPALLKLALGQRGAVTVSGDPLACARFAEGLMQIGKGGWGAGDLICRGVRAARFLGVLAGGDVVLVDDVAELFDSERECVLVVDLSVVAQRIAATAGRPLCTVHFTGSATPRGLGPAKASVAMTGAAAPAGGDDER